MDQTGGKAQGGGQSDIEGGELELLEEDGNEGEVQHQDAGHHVQVAGSEVQVSDDGDRLKVQADFDSGATVVEESFTKSQVQQIVCLLFGGDDQAQVSFDVDKPTLLDGGGGQDQLQGGSGSDTVLGGPGDDQLQLEGGGGDNLLDGGPGDDQLQGGEGKDKLLGGPGNDTCDGGPGTDYYGSLYGAANGGCEQTVSIP